LLFFFTFFVPPIKRRHVTAPGDSFDPSQLHSGCDVETTSFGPSGGLKLAALFTRCPCPLLVPLFISRQLYHLLSWLFIERRCSWPSWGKTLFFFEGTDLCWFG